jgi:hypothetical protein
MPDANSDLPRLEASEVQSPLERALAEEHAYIRKLATLAEQARPTDEDPRLHYGLTDSFSAVLCRHLAAVDDVLLPRARKELAHGHAKVRDYVRHARGLENTLHLLKARLYGDATARHRTWGEVWNGIDVWLDDHVTHEQALMHALAEHLTADEAQVLAARLLSAEEHSPTRPHPYTPHTGVLGRFAHRFWARADSFWDDAEARIVPLRRRGRLHAGDSLLSRYFTGISVRKSESRKSAGRRDSTDS